MRYACTAHDSLYTADGAHAHVAVGSGPTARMREDTDTTAAGGLQGLHQITRRAGSTGFILLSSGAEVIWPHLEVDGVANAMIEAKFWMMQIHIGSNGYVTLETML